MCACVCVRKLLYVRVSYDRCRCCELVSKSASQQKRANSQPRCQQKGQSREVTKVAHRCVYAHSLINHHGRSRQRVAAAASGTQSAASAASSLKLVASRLMSHLLLPFLLLPLQPPPLPLLMLLPLILLLLLLLAR